MGELSGTHGPITTESIAIRLIMIAYPNFRTICVWHALVNVVDSAVE